MIRAYLFIEPSKYVKDMMKYLLGVNKELPYNRLPIWCHSHATHAVASHDKNIPTNWDKQQQRNCKIMKLSLFRFIKNSLSPYEILLHYNVMRLVFSMPTFSVTSEGASSLAVMDDRAFI